MRRFEVWSIPLASLPPMMKYHLNKLHQQSARCSQPKLAPIIDSLFIRGFHAVYVFMSLAFVVIFITSLITFILYRRRAAN